jgi:hypothetical protein
MAWSFSDVERYGHKLIVYGHASDEHRNPRKIRVFNKPFQKAFLARGILRAGLYARVSTHDQQTLPLQLAAMRNYVAKQGWKTALEIQDVGSGASLRLKREELIKAARSART